MNSLGMGQWTGTVILCDIFIINFTIKLKEFGEKTLWCTILPTLLTQLFLLVTLSNL